MEMGIQANPKFCLKKKIKIWNIFLRFLSKHCGIPMLDYYVANTFVNLRNVV